MNGKWWIPWVLLAVFAGTTLLLGSLYIDANRGKRIAESNEKAALDTTRISIRGEWQAASRLLVQKDIKIRELGNALEVALRGRRSDARALVALRVQMDSVIRIGQLPDSERQDTAGVWYASFSMTGPPIEGEQVVTWPANHVNPAQLTSRLHILPFDMRIGMGCDPDHTPVTAVESPQWVPVTFQRGTVDPRMCNPGHTFFSLSLAPDVGKVAYGLAGLLIGLLAK